MLILTLQTYVILAVKKMKKYSTPFLSLDSSATQETIGPWYHKLIKFVQIMLVGAGHRRLRFKIRCKLS